VKVVVFIYLDIC